MQSIFLDNVMIAGKRASASHCDLPVLVSTASGCAEWYT